MPVRVLVVDDSAFMRKAISMMLQSEHEIEVIGTARDGIEAIEKVKELKPDVVTLDVEMPRMDGITALKKIMKDTPLPVLMVSSLTEDGAKATVDAMAAGAVDFIPKQLSYISLDITKIKEELVAKIKLIAGRKHNFFRRTPPLRPHLEPKSYVLSATRVKLVMIGISTGGPFSLQKVVPLLPADFPVPVTIVQHMPPHFTKSLAERLDSISNLRVCEAEEGMEVTRGQIFIAPGGQHMKFRDDGRKVRIRIASEPLGSLHRPSVDVMFGSALEVFGGELLAVVMTGMGHDGLEGAKSIKAAGGKVIAQDEESCVVYGMPKSIVDAQLADAVVPLEEIVPALTAAVHATAVVV